jgi:hypothetical protein
MMRQGSIQYACELDGVTYRFTKGRLDRIDDLNEIEGDKWFVSDMQKAIPRALTMETPNKYAELMVRRKLHESGEFEEPVSVMTHLKTRREKNATDIFFTAVPTRLYQHYFDQVKEHEDNVLFFPLYAILFGVLKDTRSKEPVAVVFQYSRFADLIIGDHKEVFYANRCLAFDTSEEQILALWDLVRLDIKNVEEERGRSVAKVVFINWIDSAPEPEWPEALPVELCALEQEEVTLEGQVHNISFFKAVSLQAGFQSSSPLIEKSSYYTRRWASWLNIVFTLVVFLMVSGYFWLDQKNQRLQHNIGRLENRIAKTDPQIPLNVSRQHFKKSLAFLRELDYCASVPPYRRVINDVSDALSGGMELLVLKLDYTRQAVNLEFFGTTLAPFDEAHHGYQHFLQIIRERGYVISDSRFETEIKESQLLIKLKKSI